jgi:hypothetical protein
LNWLVCLGAETIQRWDWLAAIEKTRSPELAMAVGLSLWDNQN